MTQEIMKSFFRFFLKSILKRQCGERVHRSGEKGEAVNCFNAYLYKYNEPFWVILEIVGDTIKVKRYVNNNFSESGEVFLKDLDEYSLRIIHHYGLYNLYYNSFLNYILTGWTKIDVIKCKIHKLFNNTKQFVFNKKRFAKLDRLEILRALIDMQFSGNGENFMTMDVMTYLYSLMWIMHPGKDEQEHRLQIFIDSFVESGELKFDGSCHYTVTGKAINTLSRYEEEERKHQENKKLQNRMVYLTLAIVLVGIVQAYIAYKK